MEISAKVKYLKISPRKVRLVADMIRYKSASEAEAILRFTAKKASHPLLKLLQSGLANAKNNFKKDAADLYVAKIFVDGGPMMKRTFPRSRGRADMLQKKSSHVTIVLEDKKTAGTKGAAKTKKGAVKKQEAAKASVKMAEKPKGSKESKSESKSNKKDTKK